MGLVKVRTTAWIQFKVEIGGMDGSVIKVNQARKAFNSRMMEVFQGSDLSEIIKEMFAHMKHKSKIRHWRIVGFRLIENYSWISIFIS